MSDMIKICGLWRQTKDDKTYLSGNLSSGVRILIFPNRYKKEDKHPDYQVFFAPSEKKSQSPERAETRPETHYSPPPPEDDIPF